MVRQIDTRTGKGVLPAVLAVVSGQIRCRSHRHSQHSPGRNNSSSVRFRRAADSRQTPERQGVHRQSRQNARGPNLLRSLCGQSWFGARDRRQHGQPSANSAALRGGPTGNGVFRDASALIRRTAGAGEGDFAGASQRPWGSGRRCRNDRQACDEGFEQRVCGDRC